MLVLCKILRLLVNTLTDKDKYFLLYRDNLIQPIQILLSQEKKDFFSIFLAIFQIYIKFCRFSKKDDPHSRCISRITVSGKGDQINISKIPFQRPLPQQTWQKGQKTVKICTTLPLPCFLIPVPIIQLEKVYVSAMQNLRPVS